VGEFKVDSPILSAIGKSWRASLSFRYCHVSFLYE
jgi:hypothetical protein